MKKSAAILLLIMMLWFSACSTKQPESTIPASTEIQNPTFDTTASRPTETPTEPVMQATEPLVQPLGILPGSYLDTFRDPESDNEMDYYLHIPKNTVENMPLIIFLHGDGEIGNPYVLKNFGMMKSAKDIYGSEFPFIGLSPSTKIKSWVDQDLPQTLKALIDSIVESYAIDSSRIIITGHSRGTIGVWNMISIYGDFFAAAVPISCPHQKGHIDFEQASLVPVWSFAGNIGQSELGYHKWLRQNKNILINKGGWAEFTILPGCDHGETSTAAFTQETFEWMLTQQNKEK